MNNIRVKEIYTNYCLERDSYQSFHYTLDNHWFEYWIDFHKDGIMFCNSHKLSTILSNEEYLRILTDERYRLEFMNKLIISIEEGTEQPYESKCTVIKDCNAFSESLWKIYHNDDYIDSEYLPTHHDNVEMVLVEYNKESKTIKVFDFTTMCMYTSTIYKNIFEADEKPYSINLFMDIENDFISIENY